MGVTGLWTVVAPTARPTQLATLNRKRLAVDASIWIYQFLKAVRDKEGNALRNSHVVGFFRRICKLLFFGIKPVFVFDGGAPTLKRETVRSRARRREGRREDAAKTAGKLLGMQMQRAAEEEMKAKRVEVEMGVVPAPEEEVEALPTEQEMVYVDEIGMSAKERTQNRQFRKKDQYHLPDLDISIESMGAPDDPRIMSQAELEEYAKQFHRGEDINLYDFTKIDFESPFFLSLPPSDRYNILNAARLRSRLRMGYSKEQLDDMFPDRMAFSRFQIERVRERNELTQRLMHVNGMAEDFLNQGGRIAGEKGKEYILVKNDGVEGGWALGVVSNKGTEKDAIDLDADEVATADEDREEDDAEDFEDVPIEGLNRIPKRWVRKQKDTNHDPDGQDPVEEIARKRRAVYKAREAASRKAATQQDDPKDEELFFQEEKQGSPGGEEDDLFEDVVPGDQDEQDDLRRAIEMSLLGTTNDEPVLTADTTVDTLNKVRENTTDKAGGFLGSSSDEEEEDIQAILAAARKRRTDAQKLAKNVSKPSQKGKFDGPLPFESLNLGPSILGKEKADQIEQNQAGGFERASEKRKAPAAPLPSWFAVKDWTDDSTKRHENSAENGGVDSEDGPEVFKDQAGLMRDTQETIDVDKPSQSQPGERIIFDDSEEESRASIKSGQKYCLHKEEEQAVNIVEAEKPFAPEKENTPSILSVKSDSDTSSVVLIDEMDAVKAQESQKSPAMDENADWSESDQEKSPEVDPRDSIVEETSSNKIQERNIDQTALVHDDEDEDEFEEVVIPDGPTNISLPRADVDAVMDALQNEYLVPEGQSNHQVPLAQDGVDVVTDEGREDSFSESDEELYRQMEIEVQEHERFTSALNNTRPADESRDFESELKQLRNQQKKDRRDADEVTQVMVQECQALLRLFGLPYITAPMEAEAQCAELVHLGLVDGIVTDDSDIFLFGGTRVYKNMFNAAKFVECYLTTDLEKEYDLNRTKLIRFAHLLGSDYTEGIAGVGPVTALEILTDFDSLEQFRDWCSQIQMGQIDGNITSAFRKKFKKQAQKIYLPHSFPDTRVDLAYLKPEVDPDPATFEWGVPDLNALRSFLMATIGWSQERTDEVLLPVIRDMNKREVEGTQANITRFFGGGVGIGGKEAAAPRNKGKTSGRMEKAFGRLKDAAAHKKQTFSGTGNDNDQNGTADLPSRKTSSGRRAKRSVVVDDTMDHESLDAEDMDDEDKAPRPVSKKKRKAR